MAVDWATRLKNVLVGEDEALNALVGGHYRETISGSIGRAAGRGVYGSTPPKWWAVHIAMPLVDGLFGLLGFKGHCFGQADEEAIRRAAEERALAPE